MIVDRRKVTTMYERFHKPLLPRHKYVRRVLLHTAAAAGILAASLVAGVFGYRYLAGLGWLDSLLNASMILAGMGPTDALGTAAGKLFASGYALFSGVAFLTVMSVVLAPVLHRFLHKHHLAG
jgi:hypothetical protein